MDKIKCLEYANLTFEGDAKELVLNQIEMFYDNTDIIINSKYNVGDDVMLQKGTFIHGVKYDKENFDWILENGFVSADFSVKTTKNKYFNCVGMWNIQNDCSLADYIKLYSGVTICYNIGRGPDVKRITKLIPYKGFESEIELTKNSEYWMWNAEQTKEIRFLPSLASDKCQMAFILNMESDYAKKMAEADIFNPNLDKDTLKQFVVSAVLDDFVDKEKDDFTTNREAGIMFGLPSKLIEGVLVGKLVENDVNMLNYVKSKLPDCYICNVDGKVIVA